MLDIAQKYTDTLKLKFLETTFDEKYKFYNGEWCEEYKPSTETWNKHEFVSVSNGEVIGHILYSIDRNTYSVSNLLAINFSDDKITFGKDLVEVIDNIFTKFNFRKLCFSVYVGNPIEGTYDKLISKYGGRIVGVKKEHAKFQDGAFYDLKMYELFNHEYCSKK